jgi:NAD(P)-dependent dehydrogenase (short-subunit alcohol dehydrogenase family)
LTPADRRVYLSDAQILNLSQIMGRNMWTAADIPDQSGRVAVVTGASSGLGLATAKVLSARGATVVFACRDVVKAERAADLIHTEDGQADVRGVRLDLASLASVREAADELRADYPNLDLLINNAGVMAVPFQRTEDGFELTLATNHLGHFALTGLLLDRLLTTGGSRIVTVSSLAHRRGVMRFDDLHGEQRYEPAAAYDESKLANLLFTNELHARLEAAGAPTIALAVHPGNVRTDLWRTSSRLERVLISPRLRPLNFWLAQSAERGALPTLRAAVDPSARGGDYYGPGGRFQYTGSPTRSKPSPRAHDAAAQVRLWEVSEQLTGVRYHFATTPSAARR